MFWDLGATLDLLRSLPNGEKLEATLLGLPNKAAQSDFARCLIVYVYGGMYVDVDAECLKRLDALLQAPGKDIYVSFNGDLNSCERGRVSPINNHWFYCPKPRFTGLWDLAVDITSLAPRTDNTWTIKHTGPHAFAAMVAKHRTEYLSWHLVEGKSIVNGKLRNEFATTAFPCAFVLHHARCTWAFTSPADARFSALLDAVYGYVRDDGVRLLLISLVVATVLVTFLSVLLLLQYKRRRNDFPQK